VALVAALLVTPGLSWGAKILIDDFNDSNYSDDGLIFDTRTLASDANTIASIGGGSLGVLDFESEHDGWVTLTYSTNSDGIDMTATGGFELEGVFLGPTGQTLTWTWTAKDKDDASVATEQYSWTVGDDPLFMDPDGDGDYTGWKTLEFKFEWSFDQGAVSISASRLVAIPIPGAVWLLGSGLIGLVGFSKKFKK
jgi:hypothetical protein